MRMRLALVMTAVFMAHLHMTHALLPSSYISPSGSDSASGSKDAPFATLGHAVLQTSANGTVHVFPGVYTSLPTISKPIKVAAHPKSSDSATTHMFSARNEYPSQFVSVGAAVTLEGLGFTQGNPYPFYGIVHVSTFGDLHMSNCLFTDNTRSLSVLRGRATVRDTMFDLSSGGQGVRVSYTDGDNGAIVDLKDVAFLGNKDAPTGNGIDITDGPTEVAIANAEWVGIATAASISTGNKPFSLSISNCNVTDGRRGIWAYGMFDAAGPFSRIIIDKSAFKRISNDNDGGAVYSGAAVSVAITDSTFADVGVTDEHAGAALYCGKASSMSVIASSFTNTYAYDGAPAYCSSDCGFVGSDNVVKGSQSDKNTGPCNGLAPL